MKNYFAGAQWHAVTLQYFSVNSLPMALDQKSYEACQIMTPIPVILCDLEVIIFFETIPCLKIWNDLEGNSRLSFSIVATVEGVDHAHFTIRV